MDCGRSSGSFPDWVDIWLDFKMSGNRSYVGYELVARVVAPHPIAGSAAGYNISIDVWAATASGDDAAHAACDDVPDVGD